MAEEAEKGRSAADRGRQDQWQQAKAAACFITKTYERIASLHRDGVMSLQKRDGPGRPGRRRSTTRAWPGSNTRWRWKGRGKETKIAAREQAKMAAGGVAEVEAYLADTRIASPTGEVAQVLLRSGELAPQASVVTLLDMKDAWAQFHVREDLLPRFPVGTEFDARIPGLGDQLVRFKVTHVAVMGISPPGVPPTPARGST